MSRKNVLHHARGHPRRRRRLSAPTCISRRTRGSRSRPRSSRRAISTRSSPPPARSRRSARSTSAATRSAASSTWRSTRAIASPRASSCCRSIPKTLRSRVDNGEASLQAAEVTLDQMRQSVETGARPARTDAAEPQAPAGSLGAAADDARNAGQGAERRQGGRIVAVGARENRERAGQPHRPGARQSRQRAVRSQQGPHRVADRRHRHRAAASRKARW